MIGLKLVYAHIVNDNRPSTEPYTETHGATSEDANVCKSCGQDLFFAR